MNIETVNQKIDNLVNQIYELKREVNKAPKENPLPIYPVPDWQKSVPNWQRPYDMWTTVEDWQDSQFTDHSRKIE